MKKLLLLLSIVCLQGLQRIEAGTCPGASCSAEHSCDCKATSHTFFSIRPVFTIGSPEYLVHNRDNYKTINRENGYDSCCGFLGQALQVTVFGGQSTHDEGLGRFFMPFCSTTLNVDEAAISGVTDVLANQLNIYSVNANFSSIVEFHFRHSFVGVGINYQQRFYERCDGHGFWFSISGPILQVRNRVTINENITNNGGGGVASAALTPVASSCPTTCPNSCNPDCVLDPTQSLPPVDSVVAAFSQPGWCFGRIDNKTHKKTGVGDVTLRVGYETVKRDDCHLDSFVGVLIPTGNTPKAINVFEPIVGHNHHWAVVFGSTFGLEIWHDSCGDFTVSGEFDFNITTFFERQERRSFDLRYKPWSRYMQFYKDVAQATLASTSPAPASIILHTPGIDILTQDLKVKPGYYRMFNAACIVDTRCFEIEVGYNFFARQAECLRLGCPFPTGAALKNIATGLGETAPYAMINTDFGANCAGSPLVNYANNVITEADIDLESAAHPATLTHTVYGSLAYEWDGCCGYPMFVALGGSYEFPPDNVGLNRWMAWGKFGVAF